MISPQEADTIVKVLTLALAAVGGIPQILGWFKPKPTLKITEMKVQRGETENRYKLHLKVLNKVKWWRRRGDATYVKCEMFIMDRKHEHLVQISC